jgi:hypothetical protein
VFRLPSWFLIGGASARATNKQCVGKGNCVLGDGGGGEVVVVTCCCHLLECGHHSEMVECGGLSYISRIRICLHPVFWKSFFLLALVFVRNMSL